MIDTDGIVHRVAGQPPSDGVPQHGYSGDGGPALDALLDYPVDLAISDDGSLLFSDVFNHCIRKIDSDGINQQRRRHLQPARHGRRQPPRRRDAVEAALWYRMGSTVDSTSPTPATTSSARCCCHDRSLAGAGVAARRVQWRMIRRPSRPRPSSPPATRIATPRCAIAAQSGDHDLNIIRILADPAALSPYQDRNDPFPEGAVVLKEEYDFGDVSCSGPIKQWTVMQRLADDSSPDTLDWRWQQVDAERNVIAQDATRCIGCHTGCTPANDGYDYTCAVP